MFGTNCYIYDDKGNITKKYWRSYTTDDTVEELKYEIVSPKGIACNSALCGSSTFARSDFKGLKEYPYTTNYAYDNKGQLVGFGNKEITYDSCGHPESYLGNTLEWTNGRLTKFTKPDGTVITYTYDASGYRISKTVDGQTTKYYYGHNGSIIQENHDDYFINYKYDATGICGFDLVYMDGDIYKNGYFHYVKDLLGNVKYILDNDGNIVVEYNYDAWGKCNAIWHDSATVGDRVFTNLQDLNPIRYRGYYYDSETGLYYLINRYYAPEVGRFISIDDANYLDFESLFGQNRYAYCANNPVMHIDPEGNIFFTTAVIVGAIIGAVVGAAAGFGVAAYNDYKDDGEIFNGSVAWYDYVGATVVGGTIGSLVGGSIGYIAPQVASAISSFASTSFTIGGGLSISSSGVAVASAGVTITGAQILNGVGVLNLMFLFSYGADRFKQKDNRSNQVQNEEFKRLCDEYDLNKTQRDRIHHRITKKGYSKEQIIELIKRFYPNIRKR